MTKKEFIWLGIHTIGFYSLLKLTLTFISFSWRLGYLLITMNNAPEKISFHSMWTPYILSIPVPLILTIYFLFFGTLIHKFISHCVHTRPEDVSQPAGYFHCEVVVRFVGLIFIGLMLHKVYISIITYLQSYLMFRPTDPQYLEAHREAIFKQFFNLGSLLSMLFYLLLVAFFAWYFLKKGKLFINLLNRLWLRKNKSDLNQNPVNPV
ncbi:MAG: hypothetical protein ACYSUS_02225 [Planctomycetota bacterium]|jgi:uncharacterized protein YacL